MANRPIPGLFSRVGTFISRRRRLVAAVLAGAAMACALTVLRPPAPDRIEVLVAAGDLAGGTQLSESDLATVRLRPAVVPEGALHPRTDVTGRMLAGPMRSGEPLTDAAIAGEALLAESGLVATPVRIADDGVTRLLQAGARVDILAASMRGESLGEPARVVAPGVRVIAVPQAEEGVGGVPGEGALIMVAATSEEAAMLASAAVTSRLTVTLRSG